MTLLETLALATLIVTVVYETVDVTLKVLQYIESKQNKKKRCPATVFPTQTANLF